MLSKTGHGRHQLLRFTVPGLPEQSLGVALFEVLAVDELPSLTPIPFTPSFVLGMAEWRDNLATAIDMARLFRHAAGNQETSQEQGVSAHERFVIAQAVVDGQREIIAWPVLLGAGVLTAPPQIERVETPSYLDPVMVQAAFILNDQLVVLLNLEGLITLVHGIPEASIRHVA
jgi:chemotaxis signal transduction protein